MDILRLLFALLLLLPLTLPVCCKINVEVIVSSNDDNSHTFHRGNIIDIGDDGDSHSNMASSKSSLSSYNPISSIGEADPHDAMSAPTHPQYTLPQQYHFVGVYVVPSADVVEPLEFWFDGINYRRRAEYFDGLDVYITRGDLNGTTYQTNYEDGKGRCLITEDDTQRGKNVSSILRSLYLSNLTLQSNHQTYTLQFGPHKGNRMDVNVWEYDKTDRDLKMRTQIWKYTWLVRADNNMPVLIQLKVFDADKPTVVMYEYSYELSLFEPTLGHTRNVATLFDMPILSPPCIKTNFNVMYGGEVTADNPTRNFSSTLEKIYSIEYDKLEQNYEFYLKSIGRAPHPDPAVNNMKKSVFVHNAHKVVAHNKRFAKGEESYKQRLHSGSDDLPEEKNLRRGLKIDPIVWGYQNVTVKKLVDDLPEGLDRWKNVKDAPQEVNLYARFYEPRERPLPKSIDWRTAIPGVNIVGPIHDQDYCGSCWAFSASHVISSHHAKIHHQYTWFSVPQILDCSWRWGNNGCDGGDPIIAQAWVAANDGLFTMKDYGPYLDQDGKCGMEDVAKAHPHALKARVDGVEIIHDHKDLLDALAFRGPVSIAVNFIDELRDYSGGVFDIDPKKCPSTLFHLDHAILAIGFGHDDATGKDYILAWNQWGESYGDESDPGTYKIAFARDGSQNTCGIATAASIPTMKGSKEEERLLQEARGEDEMH